MGKGVRISQRADQKEGGKGKKGFAKFLKNKGFFILPI